MPAVVLSRLKIQAAQVCESAGDPAVFLRRLHNLFDDYADRTRRPGRSVSPQSLLPHYNIPRPVIKQLQSELERVISKEPLIALPLADILWADGWLETRLLAAAILDLVKPDPVEPVVERLTAWAMPGEDVLLLDALLASGSSRLQVERPDLWLSMIENWLDNPTTAVQRIGLRALLSLAGDGRFNNLPAVFRLLNPVLKKPASDLTPDLLEVVEALAKRSPAETAFYLRQISAGGRYGSLPRFVRKCLPFFDSKQQAILKEVLSAG